MRDFKEAKLLGNYWILQNIGPKPKLEMPAFHDPVQCLGVPLLGLQDFLKELRKAQQDIRAILGKDGLLSCPVDAGRFCCNSLTEERSILRLSRMHSPEDRRLQ